MHKEIDRGRWILSQVIVPVVVSAVTAVLVVLAIDRGGSAPPTPAPRTVAAGGATAPAEPAEEVPDDATVIGTENRKAIAELRAAITVAGDPDLRIAVRDPGKYTGELLDRLDDVRPEQQFVITEALNAFARLGDRAVPDILAKLRSDDLWDLGGGPAFQGPVIKGYRSQRLVLLDALRQIGTPTAKEGALAFVRENGELEAYRDLMALYNGTQDEQMVEGITALLPALYEKLESVGLDKANERASLLMMLLSWWLNRHGAQGCEEALARLVEQAYVSGTPHRTEGMLGAIIESDPEMASKLILKLIAEDAENRRLHRLARSVWEAKSRARSVRVYEILLVSAGLDGDARWILFSSVQAGPSYHIESPEEKLTDLLVLKRFLGDRLATETEVRVREQLERLVKGVDESVKRLKDDDG